MSILSKLNKMKKIYITLVLFIITVSFSYSQVSGYMGKRNVLKVGVFLKNSFVFPNRNGENGFMYVRKSPACTLETLAKAVCSIFKYKKGFMEVGIRAGEKIHETLVSREELLRAVDSKEYYKIPPESQGLDYNKYFFRGNMLNMKILKPYTSENAQRLDVSETTAFLLKLPEIKEELENLGK